MLIAADFWGAAMGILPIEQSQKKTQMRQKWAASARPTLKAAAPTVADDLGLRLAEYWHWADSESAV